MELKQSLLLKEAFDFFSKPNTKKEVADSYRKLSMQLHPDRTKTDTSKEVRIF
jgi:curved DNA-binding protein CbpA